MTTRLNGLNKIRTRVAKSDQTEKGSFELVCVFVSLFMCMQNSDWVFEESGIPSCVADMLSSQVQTMSVSHSIMQSSRNVFKGEESNS